MAVFPSLDTIFKAFLLPASIALGLYLTAIYIVYPLYARRQRYAHYLPVSLDVEDSSSLLGRTRSGLNRALNPVRNTGVFSWIGVLRERVAEVFPPLPGSRRSRTMSFDTYFGDEELDDGVLNSQGGGGGFTDLSTNNAGRDGGSDQGSERRLSRELEVGFRDDSDSEEEDRRIGQRR